MMSKNLKTSNSRGSLQKILYKPNSLYIQTTLRSPGIKPGLKSSWCTQCEDGEIIPVEVKSGSRTRAKSLASYLERYHPSRAVMLAGKPAGKKTDVLQHWPLYEAQFLSQL